MTRAREQGAGPVDLLAGGLVAEFEPATCMLRYVAANGRELLRGIYPTVRDRNWGTVEPEVTDLQVQQDEGSFELRFAARCAGDDIDFGWEGVISGKAGGSIVFTVEGRARSSFERNRVGLCVLHPPHLAGASCAVHHTDGSRTESAFPRLISPHQPFFDMASIEYEAAPGLRVEVAFRGDVFEMEDQRNWTDASFKTYCTPLARLFPVRVEAGDMVRQEVSVIVAGAEPPAASEAGDPAVVRVRERRLGLPHVGVARASHGRALTEREASRLRALGLAHLHAEVAIGPGWEDAVATAGREAEALGLALELALVFGEGDRSPRPAMATTLEDVRLARLIVLDEGRPATTEETVLAAREVFASVGAPLVAGTSAFFTELNRNRPTRGVLQAIDGVCYSLNPQVHAFDDRSLVETTTAQGVTVETARSFAPDVGVHVGPVTLEMRFNPNATSGEPDEPEPAAGERRSEPGARLPDRVDVRQMQPFAACWTLGSIRDLALAGADSVTYFETTGWLGVMEREAGSSAPEVFPSEPGMAFPIFHVLADLGAWAGRPGVQVLEADSSDPLAVQALVLADDARRRLLMANMTDEPVRVQIHGLGVSSLMARVLDESTLEEATRSPEAFRNGRPRNISLAEPIDLPPRAYLCGDGEVAA